MKEKHSGSCRFAAIENTFRREEVFYLTCNAEQAFFDSEEHKKYSLWTYKKVTETLVYLLDNRYIKSEWLLPVNWQQRFYVKIAAAS